MFMVSALSLSFLGAEVGETYFMRTLNSVAIEDPGLVLVGESVDVDIDEPAVTIRWSILACGEGLVLPGSSGILGSKGCGLPVQPLQIFVDSQGTPTATYDPAQIPYNKDTGNRRNIENLVRFDSDHVLDVHSTRLYPFDRYLLSSSLRAATMNNETIRISRAITLRITSSFDIDTDDLESFVLAPVIRNQTNSTIAGNDTSGDAEVHLPSRDIDMHISRPPSAQFFTFLLFGASWILTHISVGLAVLARKRKDPQALLAYLLSSGLILVGIPQLRNGMPDAPGFDGILLDCIGFFPQMIITSICIALLLFTIVEREIDVIQGHTNENTLADFHSTQGPHHSTAGRSQCCRSSIISSFPKPPSATTIVSTGEHNPISEVRSWHFPPVSPPRPPRPVTRSTPTSPLSPLSPGGMLRKQQSAMAMAERFRLDEDIEMDLRRKVSAHKRAQTTSRITEEREVSRWSDHEDDSA
ncbi:hypothetical protein H1R20_g1603, partial [Candolleomyces eurysporus]